MLPRTQPPRQAATSAQVAPGRFSPLNAPQRAAVDAFCAEARPWALRQARRTYRHLPVELHEQAADQAMLELRSGAVTSFDRRTLYSALASSLDESLRRVHVGWCLNQSSALWREEAATRPTLVPEDPGPATASDGVSAFVEEGLGGLERAVLQLELGAGRDSQTVRAALRLGPRQYARHREQGLGKLRAAVLGHVTGRVCDQHRDTVMLAATGDPDAADRLASGPDRCRACAREATALRRTLHQRLAVAPWPLAIKPAGLLAAKLGAAGAILKGKGAGLAALGTGPIGTGAGAVATVLAVAAVATSAGGPAEKETAERAPTAATAAKAPEVRAERATASKPAARRTTTAAKRAATGKRQVTGAAPAARKPQTAPAATPASAPPAVPAPVATPALPSVGKSVDETVQRVRETARPVTKVLPAPVQETVEQTVETVRDTVGQVTGTVDELLAPKK